MSKDDIPLMNKYPLATTTTDSSEGRFPTPYYLYSIEFSIKT